MLQHCRLSMGYERRVFDCRRMNAELLGELGQYVIKYILVSCLVGASAVPYNRQLSAPWTHRSLIIAQLALERYLWPRDRPTTTMLFH